MGVEDPRVNQLEWSVADVKQAVKLLTQLALKADERMETLLTAQAQSEGKIAELAVAQLRTEEAIQRLSTALETLSTSAAGLDGPASGSGQPNANAARHSSDE